MSAVEQLDRIAISKQNKKRLSHLGYAGESYNDVVTHVVDHYIDCPSLKSAKKEES